MSQKKKKTQNILLRCGSTNVKAAIDRMLVKNLLLSLKLLPWQQLDLGISGPWHFLEIFHTFFVFYSVHWPHQPICFLMRKWKYIEMQSFASSDMKLRWHLSFREMFGFQINNFLLLRPISINTFMNGNIIPLVMFIFHHF